MNDHHFCCLRYVEIPKFFKSSSPHEWAWIRSHSFVGDPPWLPCNNVLLVKIEGPVWYTVYGILPVKGVSSNPSFFINQPMGKGHLCSHDLRKASSLRSEPSHSIETSEGGVSPGVGEMSWRNIPWLGMVYTTYKNGDDLGMVEYWVYQRMVPIIRANLKNYQSCRYAVVSPSNCVTLPWNMGLSCFAFITTLDLIKTGCPQSSEAVAVALEKWLKKTMVLW